MGQSSMSARPRSRSIVGPVLLIVVGGLLLLNTMGLVEWNVWQTLWRFWPVALILLGLELVVGRGNPWASALLMVAVLAVAVPLAFFATFLPFGWTIGSPTGSQVTQAVSLPLEGAREANLRVQFSAGNLFIGALGEDTANLLGGEVLTEGMPVEIERGNEANTGRANVTVRHQGGARSIVNVRDGDRWTLNVNRSVPLNLRVEGGAAEVNLDLRLLKVQTLSLEVGAATTRVQMPQNAGYTRATLRSGMSETRIEVPQGVAARINARSGMSSIEVDESRFPKRDGYYQSPGYESAANKVEIDVEAGMASVKVR